jgi:hypothetical protein
MINENKANVYHQLNILYFKKTEIMFVFFDTPSNTLSVFQYGGKIESKELAHKRLKIVNQKIIKLSYCSPLWQ